MPLFVMTYTKVYSKPFNADSLKEAEAAAKFDIGRDKGQVLIAIRTGAEHQAAIARGEVG
jgi:hypothetical protein